jgi:GDP-L-galactose phosphorylase
LYDVLTNFYLFFTMQCYAEKQAMGEMSQELLDTQVNPAVWEISGHIVLKRRNDYEEASETSAWKLLAEVSLSEERFEEVKAYIFTAAGLVQSDEVEVSEGESTTYTPVPVNPVPVTEGCFVLQ